jgi:hypothetical protein
MKRNLVIILGILGLMLYLQNCNTSKTVSTDVHTGATVISGINGNSVYYESDPIKMKVGSLTVKGEVKNPGRVDLSKLYQHEIVVREATLDGSSEIAFSGAYRYIGYSLLDILNPFLLDKKNAANFKPQMDVYIVIKNDKGESVVFSWSEIFHVSQIHQILIATEAAPLKPHKVEVNYPIGESWRVVAGNDLFSYRILENPTEIIVYSFDKKDYEINREINPMYSPEVSVIKDGIVLQTIPVIEDRTRFERNHSIFYGMGMGYHDYPIFEGISLPELTKEHINPFDKEMISNGLVCFASLDGYRAIYSFSELYNRNDQVVPILAVPENSKDGGYYRNYLSSDFFADRSVKSLKEIYFFKP